MIGTQAGKSRPFIAYRRRVLSKWSVNLVCNPLRGLITMASGTKPEPWLLGTY